MIDSHCHLDFDVFSHDLPQVIQRAQRAGIDRFLIPGTTLGGWSRQQILASEYTNIDYAIGFHPYFIDENWREYLDAFERHWENDSGAIAVGETGIDARLDVDLSVQITIFEKHLAVAKALGKPIIVHHQKSHHHLIRVIKTSQFQCGGIIHAFNGSLEVAKEYIDLGFLLGIGGTITYDRANKTRETVKQLDMRHLVLETDSPDMPIMGFQGQRNEPSRLTYVLEQLSKLKELDKATIATNTSENYYRLFARNL